MGGNDYLRKPQATLIHRDRISSFFQHSASSVFGYTSGVHNVIVRPIKGSLHLKGYKLVEFSKCLSMRLVDFHAIANERIYEYGEQNQLSIMLTKF